MANPQAATADVDLDAVNLAGVALGRLDAQRVEGLAILAQALEQPAEVTPAGRLAAGGLGQQLDRAQEVESPAETGRGRPAFFLARASLRRPPRPSRATG